MKKILFLSFLIFFVSCGIKGDPEEREGKMNFIKGYQYE